MKEYALHPRQPVPDEGLLAHENPPPSPRMGVSRKLETAKRISRVCHYEAKCYGLRPCGLEHARSGVFILLIGAVARKSRPAIHKVLGFILVPAMFRDKGIDPIAASLMSRAFMNLSGRGHP